MNKFFTPQTIKQVLTVLIILIASLTVVRYLRIDVKATNIEIHIKVEPTDGRIRQ